MTLTWINILLTLLMLFIIICVGSCSAPPSPENLYPGEERNQIILATTTSTQDSGLLDYLLPTFQERSGFIVKTIAVGTGKALKMAEDGNADVLFVHAPSAEKELVDNGFGINRSLVMHNDFVIVGPLNDPAGISGMESAIDAFQRILISNPPFVSRGDDSGTHKKELTFWNDIGDIPKVNRYLETGQGMAATLRIASEKDAYTLTDRATFLTNQDFLDLAILVEGDNDLLNVYHVIMVNPAKWPQVNFVGAQSFTSFLLSAETQALIGDFGVDIYDQPLFFPDAGKTGSELGIE
jgi:tungstate transport system substrate-binding protein